MVAAFTFSLELVFSGSLTKPYSLLHACHITIDQSSVVMAVRTTAPTVIIFTIACEVKCLHVFDMLCLHSVQEYGLFVHIYVRPLNLSLFSFSQVKHKQTYVCMYVCRSLG